jgi:hypothetical protein
MTDPARRLADNADALRSAAQRLHDDTVDPACASFVPATLNAIEDALTTLSRSCFAAAHVFVPLGSRDTSIAERYGRAAATWPSPRSGTGPSHEQQARVLSSLHDAGAAVRAAAAHCRRAADNLAATMEPSEHVAEERERTSEAA